MIEKYKNNNIHTYYTILMFSQFYWRYLFIKLFLIESTTVFSLSCLFCSIESVHTSLLLCWFFVFVLVLTGFVRVFPEHESDLVFADTSHCCKIMPSLIQIVKKTICTNKAYTTTSIITYTIIM